MNIPLILLSMRLMEIVSDVAHGIGANALIHFKICMRLLIFIEVRLIIYQKFQHFANINNLMLK